MAYDRYIIPNLRNDPLSNPDFSPDNANQSDTINSFTVVPKSQKKVIPESQTEERAVDRKIQTFQEALNAEKFENDIRPEYKVHILSEVVDVNNEPIRVSAFLPESIDIDYSSDYRTPFYDNPLPGRAGDILKAFGNTGIVQEMTYKVWDGSRGISISLPLVFVADDEYEAPGSKNFDINTPILKLLKLCAPSKGESSFLNPPGPTLDFTSTGSVMGALNNEVETDSGVDESKDSNIFVKAGNSVGNVLKSSVAFNRVTTIYLGNALTLPNVIIEDVSQAYDTMFDNNGKFMRGKVNLRFSTVFTPTIEDLNSYYGRSDMNIKRSSSGGE